MQLQTCCSTKTLKKWLGIAPSLIIWACSQNISERPNELKEAHELLWKYHKNTESWRLCPFSPLYNIDGSGVFEGEEESKTHDMRQVFPSCCQGLCSIKWKWSHSVMSDSSDPMDCSLPGSSIHGIFQARVLEWVAIAFSNIPSAAAKSLQSCPTLCDPRDDSPPGSPVPGILQARTLEWVAISFSKGKP